MSVARMVAESVLVPHEPRPTASRGVAGLAWALALVSSVAALGTLWWPDLLTGTAVMNGSARGTALVVLVLAVPLLVGSLSGRLGPTWSIVGALGATAYLLYNAVLFSFATPLNHAFLVYVAMLGLGFWCLARLVHEVGTGSVLPTRAHRLAAAWILAVVTLNALAWLAAVVPASFSDRPTSVLDGTGLTTNPVYVQDLALWLPALTWIAVQLWRGRGTVLGAGALAFWTLEAVGVAVDQWRGHAADPSSDVASAAVVPMFLAVAAVTGTVLWLLSRESRGGLQGRRGVS